MVVAYATAPDDVAKDGEGRNSPFTAALKRLQEPGLEIGMMFRRVASDVNAQTGGRQRPETYISLLSDYYLNQSDSIAWTHQGPGRRYGAARLREQVSSSPRANFARSRLEAVERFAKEREDLSRRAREDEQRKAAEAEEQRLAREAAARRETESVCIPSNLQRRGGEKKNRSARKLSVWRPRAKRLSANN